MIHDKIHCTTLSNQKKIHIRQMIWTVLYAITKQIDNLKEKLFSYVKEITQTDSYTSYWHKPITTSLIHFDKTCITINTTWGFPVVPIQNKINRAMLLHPGTINFFFSY